MAKGPVPAPAPAPAVAAVPAAGGQVSASSGEASEYLARKEGQECPLRLLVSRSRNAPPFPGFAASVAGPRGNKITWQSRDIARCWNHQTYITNLDKRCGFECTRGMLCVKATAQSYIKVSSFGANFASSPATWKKTTWVAACANPSRRDDCTTPAVSPAYLIKWSHPNRYRRPQRQGIISAKWC